MKPQQIEDQRYKTNDHCRILLEEKLMFELLEDWFKKSGKQKTVVKILDLGCGSGVITKELQKLGYKVKGLDFSEEAIKKALSLGIDARLCNLDEGITENDKAVDVIWAGDIIEHVFDPIALIQEIWRVLKDDGILILCIPSDVGMISRIKMLFGYSYQEITYKKYGYHKHHTFFNLKLISFMLDKAGFKTKRILKILILGGKRYRADLLPSAFYNELVILAGKRK